MDRPWQAYGAIENVTMATANPLGTSAPNGASGAASAPGGPWFATLAFKEAAGAAKAVGARYLYVAGKRVYVEVVP